MNNIKQTKDLSWLSAPAFFLLLMMIGINAKKQNSHRPPEKTKPDISAVLTTKQS
jgi:hypothetical protein